jgi:uncharacterized protein
VPSGAADGEKGTMPDRSAPQLAAVLGLLPHREGGYFRETYRSPIQIPTPAGMRSLTTAILYMLTASDPSRFHRLRFDEVWFFHGGAQVEMVFLDPLETVVIGPEAPQALAPGGRWMAARVLEGVSGAAAQPAARDFIPAPECAADPGVPFEPAWALVGCLVSPGFEYDDFEAGRLDDLLASYPEAADYIPSLTGG